MVKSFDSRPPALLLIRPLIADGLCSFQMDVLARIEDREIGVGLSKWASADDIEKAIVTVRDEPRYRNVTVSVFQLACSLENPTGEELGSLPIFVERATSFELL